MSTTTEMIKESLDQMNSAVESFKSEQSHRVDKISSDLERLQIKMSRPGAFANGETGSGPLTFIKSMDGRDFPLLSKGDRLASLGNTGQEFSIGEFCRDAIIGSRKAMGSGPALVPTGLSDQFIDDVRALAVIAEAGAKTVVIDGPRVFAKITQDPTVYQHTENVDDIQESDVLAAPLTVDPKVLAAIIPVSEEVVSDSPNLDQVLRTSLASAFAQKLEALALAKLVADANIAQSGAAQDPALWAKVMEAISAAMAAGKPLPKAMISAASDFVARASQLASTSGNWLGKPPALAGMLELPTSNLAAGKGFFGDFSLGLMIAARSELRVEVIRWKNPTKAQHALVAHARLDAYVVQPKALFRQLKTI